MAEDFEAVQAWPFRSTAGVVLAVNESQEGPVAEAFAAARPFPLQLTLSTRRLRTRGGQEYELPPTHDRWYLALPGHARTYYTESVQEFMAEVAPHLEDAWFVTSLDFDSHGHDWRIRDGVLTVTEREFPHGVLGHLERQGDGYTHRLVVNESYGKQRVAESVFYWLDSEVETLTRLAPQRWETLHAHGAALLRRGAWPQALDSLRRCLTALDGSGQDDDHPLRTLRPMVLADVRARLTEALSAISPGEALDGARAYEPLWRQTDCARGLELLAVLETLHGNRSEAVRQWLATVTAGGRAVRRDHTPADLAADFYAMAQVRATQGVDRYEEAVDWLLAALVVRPSLEATARAEPGLATLCADPRVRARLDAAAGSRPPQPRALEAIWHHGYHKGEHHPLPYPFHTHLVETEADVADLLAVLGEGDDEVLLIDADAPTRQSAGHSLRAAVAHGFTYFGFSDPGHRAWWTVGDPASPPHSPHWWDTRYPPGSGLPASRAATVIREFLHTGARPTCVRWSRRA
ncbi:Imm1 family immunity protein [Streptomyces sp. NBC_01314]|uniref:Imm1 family immunity protein n=1 Tax=Streptomyces sp. NBC_01314 TaxID=2903821 RepID=UPI003087BC38|nr:Imm1 family immunity protein [Streptomyces sp. NBC_01314]